MMKIKLLFFVIVLSSFLFSCNNKKVVESKTIIAKSITLKINGDINNLLQIDSIFTDIKTIPLETKDECLIEEIVKAIFYDDKLFLQDNMKRLLVFNTNGKFLYEIGKIGRGPGEFLDIRDFDIDKEGNIYILSFLKILKYNCDGTFLKGFSYHFAPTDEFYCNPLQFALKSDSNFYIWGGSIGIEHFPDRKFFAMYEMTKEGVIINKYFPVNYSYANDFHQFKRFRDLILIDPIFGSNIIYSIDKEGVMGRYNIDFGTNTSKIPLPKEFTTSRSFKLEIYDKYFHSIRKFTEIDDWIYFMFQSKSKGSNVYYSKKLHKSFVSKQWPLVSGRIAPYKISANYNDNFIAFIDPKYVIEDLNKCKAVDFNSLPASEKKNMKRLEKIKETDNPVMFICSLKEY